MEPCPVREPSTLDARRADLGLPPASTALATLRQRLAAPPNHASTTADTVVLTILAGAA
ncbi:hypothetical protein [Streptomyces nigra]|uniref:hypothetical protein n=1 Tax=Streptomyces nigra TaxID=1827580 RepID=UPI0036360473